MAKICNPAAAAAAAREAEYQRARGRVGTQPSEADIREEAMRADAIRIGDWDEVAMIDGYRDRRAAEAGDPDAQARQAANAAFQQDQAVLNDHLAREWDAREMAWCRQRAATARLAHSPAGAALAAAPDVIDDDLRADREAG
jgi:hypothetical protein